MPVNREVGAPGQCEVIDWIPTRDDAVPVRCTREGRVIRERLPEGGMRLRCVCGPCGQDSAMTVN